MDSQYRRPLAAISVYGITFLHRQNPLMVAWWSAAFPGFGHYMLNQYVRATLFTLTEVIINTLAHLNEAIIYSFCGKFEMAKSVIHVQWVYGYLAIYFYTIWDGYRSAVTQNKMCQLAELENDPLKNNLIHPLEIQYLEQKSPLTTVVQSFLFPGLGQIYNHRCCLAFYAMFWWWIYAAFSHFYQAVFYLFMGNIPQSVSVLRPHWLMFMPSVLGGSIYQALITTNAHNKLFKIEQRQYLLKKYEDSEVLIFD